MMEQYSIVFFCIYSRFYCIFIHTHPRMDTGGFHISTVLNKAAITWGCRYLSDVLFLFSLDKYPEVGLLDQTVVLFLIFLWNLQMVFHNGWATNRAQREPKGSLFSASSPAPVIS